MLKTIVEKNLNDECNKEDDYEKNNSIKEMVNIFFIPILNSIPCKLQFLVKKTHPSAKKVIENKTSHIALEALYNKGVYSNKQNLKETIFQKIWFNTNNSKAVRNRLKAVKRELFSFSQQVIDQDNDLYIFSIASGSARAITESISNLKNQNNKKIAVSFLDKNPIAIEYSKEKFLTHNSNPNLIPNWHLDTASNFYKHIQDKKPDIIEMVGLLDYFDDKKTLEIFKKIYANLEDGGIFITANIDDNSERPFVTNFVDWNMVYRNGKDLFNLITKAGFKKENIKIFYEPLKIHAILVAKK